MNDNLSFPALRTGFTTGACATAAAKAAFAALLTGRFPNPVTITLPRGQRVDFSLAGAELQGDHAWASIIKDAGDDPDVTHGAYIQADITRLNPGDGVIFTAGPGVGTVTRPGLPLAVGEAAINPVPRTMMEKALAELAQEHHTHPDARITISIPHGEELAQSTWNARLGIMGGLSILGTTGIVHPYSCAAWIAAIHRGIDVIRASGAEQAGAATGKTSEWALRQHLHLAPDQIIDMGDFAGAMLKYLRHHPIPRLFIALGFGKGIKLAQGHMDLHSGRSQIDFLALSRAVDDPDLSAIIAQAPTALAVWQAAQARSYPLGDSIAALAHSQARHIIGSGCQLKVLLCDRQGHIIGRA